MSKLLKLILSDLSYAFYGCTNIVAFKDIHLFFPFNNDSTTVNLKFFNYNNQKNSKETLIITEDEDIQDEKYFKKLYYNLPISITKKESTEESSTDSSNS